MIHIIRATLVTVLLISSATAMVPVQIDQCQDLNAHIPPSPNEVLFSTLQASYSGPPGACSAAITRDVWFCVPSLTGRTLEIEVLSNGCPVILEFFGSACPDPNGDCISCWFQNGDMTKGNLPAPVAGQLYYFRIATEGALGCAGSVRVSETDKIGRRFCMAQPNNTNARAVMCARGSRLVADNNVTLESDMLPPGAFGFFIVSPTQGFVANPGGSLGDLCLGGQIGRFVGPGMIQAADVNGLISLPIDLTVLPAPTGTVSVNPGDTYNFQAWYRDTASGLPSSNFSEGLEVSFL